MPRALAFHDRLLREHRTVVGASSLGFDPARNRYEHWAHLPYVTQEQEFSAALLNTIAEFNIGYVYTPNMVAWNVLQTLLPRIAPDVVLINESPESEELARYRNALERALALQQTPSAICSSLPAKKSMSTAEAASLLLNADAIPGMCSHEKAYALCEIARYAPEGDIVEIGSWWGKSAYILAQLAKSYQIGCLLCVDPWSQVHLMQHDGTSLVDAASSRVDADEALRIFEMNLLPVNARHINYLRLPSVDAAKQYKTSPTVSTATFGETCFRGRISILHIDGNHSEQAVRADVEAWSNLVVVNGWIIFDDYLWPHGEGPRRVADEFLSSRLDSIACAFAMGGALFIQLL